MPFQWCRYRISISIGMERCGSVKGNVFLILSLFSFVLCMQLACCCGTAACSCCCNCCPKIKQSTGTRFMYAFYFLLVTTICVIMMSPTVEQGMRDNVSTYITLIVFMMCGKLQEMNEVNAVKSTWSWWLMSIQRIFKTLQTHVCSTFCRSEWV